MDGRRLVYCVVLFLAKTTYFHVLAEQNSLMSEQCALEDMPFLPIIFAKSKYLPNGPCKEDTYKFMHELLNGSVWAAQMFDCSTKYPEGILYGHTRFLGNFDECYNLQVNIVEKSANIREINGKYCLVDIKYNNKHASSTYQKPSMSKYQNNFLNMNDSFWKTIKELEDFVHVRRNNLKLAMCVPATCSAENVETALKIPLKKFGASKNIELQVAVQSASCYTIKEAHKYTFGAGIYCAILLVLLSLVIICTWYDYVSIKSENKVSTVRNFMLHFSARRSYNKITEINYTRTGLDSIYFIRFVTFLNITCMHNLMPYILNPTINAIYVEQMYKIPFITIIINPSFTINICLAMSGILLTTQLLKDLDQYKQFNVVRNVVVRYLRLTPVYAVIIGFYIWILPLLGSGPFWNVVTEECAYCAKNWWTNLLYINNYVMSSDLCVLQGWYLAADFQLFVCSQFLIYAFWRMPRKVGYAFLSILTLISCIVLFVATYIYGATPIVKLAPYTTNMMDRPELKSYYIKSHICATGYLVGIIAGAILHDYKDSTSRLSKFWSHVLVCPLPAVLYIATQYWAHKFFISDNRNLLEEGLYAFLQRLIPALCTCFTIVSLSIGSQLEFYYRLLTPRWIQPFANLTYAAFIVHYILIIYNIGQAKTAKSFSLFATIWDNTSLLFWSFLISLFLAICFEMPFRSLTKQLFYERSAIKRNKDL